MGASNVVAGVRKRQLSQAASIGAREKVALDDDQAFARLPQFDIVATTVQGTTAAMLMGRVRTGGVFPSVTTGPPITQKITGRSWSKLSCRSKMQRSWATVGRDRQRRASTLNRSSCRASRSRISARDDAEGRHRQSLAGALMPLRVSIERRSSVFEHR
jgi:hypothetical protein